MMRMKKLCEYFIRYIFVFLILGVCFLEPVQVNAEEANTLRGLRQELKELQDQKRKNAVRTGRPAPEGAGFFLSVSGAWGVK